MKIDRNVVAYAVVITASAVLMARQLWEQSAWEVLVGGLLIGYFGQRLEGALKTGSSNKHQESEKCVDQTT
jgi:hypothetical protein